MKNMAGFNGDFRFTREKHICAAPKKEARLGCNNIKIKNIKETFMKHTRILFLIALLAAAAVGLPSIRGATITVVNTNDSGAGSLRQAIADAHDGDTIEFGVTGTITLTTGELIVQKSITINGPGSDNLAVDGNHASRVFHVRGGVTATISGLTITNGSASGNSGGGIDNDHSTLTVSDCTLSGNSSDFHGGGISNDGFRSDVFGGIAALTVTNSTLSGNSAGVGGGIYNDGYFGSATLTISNTTLSGNSANVLGGGGISNYGVSGSTTLTVTNSTLSGNSAIGYGAGIFNFG